MSIDSVAPRFNAEPVVYRGRTVFRSTRVAAVGLLLATLFWGVGFTWAKRTGAAPAGFGRGEMLGLGCAAVFSLYIIAVNLLVPRDDPWRMTAGQFLVAGVGCLVTCVCLRGGAAAVASGVMFQRAVAVDAALL